MSKTEDTAVAVEQVASLPQFVSTRQVLEMVNLDRRTLDRLVKQKRFPSPVRLGPRTRRWNLQKLSAWLERQEGI